MHSLVDWKERYDEVETKLQAASRYVRPSEDLRRRTLEAARLAAGKQRSRSRFRQASLAAAVVGIAVSIRTSAELRQPSDSAAAVQDHGAQRSVGAGGFGWSLLRALYERHEAQAEAADIP
jgi:cell division septum initiation protein DivIVA